MFLLKIFATVACSTTWYLCFTGFSSITYLLECVSIAIRQIATAHGPCGNNRDYIFLLEKALFNIGKPALTKSSLSSSLPRVLKVHEAT